jgi:hypothetical protein
LSNPLFTLSLFTLSLFTGLNVFPEVEVPSFCVDLLFVAFFFWESVLVEGGFESLDEFKEVGIWFFGEFEGFDARGWDWFVCI